MQTTQELGCLVRVIGRTVTSSSPQGMEIPMLLELRKAAGAGRASVAGDRWTGKVII